MGIEKPDRGEIPFIGGIFCKTFLVGDHQWIKQTGAGITPSLLFSSSLNFIANKPG